jgi:predicted nucleic acid-binding Zn ribbon protein
MAPPEECANCGATIPRAARACPECGADERTGWRENDHTRYDGIDLPDSAWATDSAEQPKHQTRVNGLPWYWWLVAAILCALLALSLF